MKHIFFIAASVLLYSTLSLLAQDETATTPSVQNAKTVFDIFDYIQHEIDQTEKETDTKQKAALQANVFMTASDKLLEIAKDQHERNIAYGMKASAMQCQMEAGIEGAKQKWDTFLDELSSRQETRHKAEELRFRLFISEAIKTVHTPEGWDTFKSELKPWLYRKIDYDNIATRADQIGRAMFRVAEQREGDSGLFVTELITEINDFIRSSECTLSQADKSTVLQKFKQMLERYQFEQFYRKACETVQSPESFETFKTELKSWINRSTVNIHQIPKLALSLAEKCGIAAEQTINELIEFLESPKCTSHDKDYFVTEWKKLLLTAFGSHLTLYGRTLDDKEFDWNTLRNKYVLVQFTATWCAPCHEEIPGMKEIYNKYRDKNFEIVSIYVFERGTDPVDAVKEHVEHSQLPWIILSETLAEKAGQPNYETSFGITSVPTMLLVDKTGKIIMTDARGELFKTKLAEIFE